MQIRTKGIAGALLAGLLAASVVSPQDRGDDDAVDSTHYSKPDENHTRLKPLAGRWKLVFRHYQGEGVPWLKGTGTAVFRWVLGGRFLLEDARVDLDGLSVEWLRVHAYDKALKKYVATWADSTFTGLGHLEGTFDRRKRVLRYAGLSGDPMKGRNVGVIFRLHVKQEKLRMEMSEERSGKETRLWDITGERVS